MNSSDDMAIAVMNKNLHNLTHDRFNRIIISFRPVECASLCCCRAIPKHFRHSIFIN